ncbi:MAG: patatin-like phospholipase family protein [Muribaculaceae bacterium]|nr:patatin-like phospholipase family protein [Muribaculaceae bacterium]
MVWKIEGILDRLGLTKDDTVGMALSGGGAKGFSHIGVLKAFESFGIRPDILSGVSAGSIAASLYGAGLTTDDIVQCFAEASGFSDFTEWAIPKEGFLKLNRFGKLLESWLPVRNLEDMKIPTVICATDFDHGKSVGWSKGEIVPRVMASCSIPIIFQPVKINGVNYVDGGVLRNLPAWAIRDYCTTLYGLDCSPMKRTYHYKPSVIEIAYRSFHLMTKANTPQDIRLCDHVITIDSLSHIKTFELSALRHGVKVGYETGCRALEKILGDKRR